MKIEEHLRKIWAKKVVEDITASSPLTDKVMEDERKEWESYPWYKKSWLSVYSFFWELWDRFPYRIVKKSDLEQW